MEANTDIEALQEVLHYYQRRGRVEFGAEVLDHALTVFPEPLEINVPIILAAAEVLRDNPSVEARDALHVAVVFQKGLEGIVSADRGFDAIPEIKRFDPKEL